MAKKQPKYLKKTTRPTAPGIGYVIPFFLVMAVLTVVSFIIPLRPTVSYIEKRSLAEFPEFSVEALTSGDYFDDISTWFSDTFPGRESWITLASNTESLHGYSEVMIAGDPDDFMNLDDPMEDEETTEEPEETEAPTETEISLEASVPAATESTGEPATEAVPETTEPIPETEPLPEETITLEEGTAPDLPVEEWGGVDAGANQIFTAGAVIQIGDTLFQQQGFSKNESKRYTNVVNKVAETYADKGIRVVSAQPPQSVGVMIEPEYLPKIKCADQAEISAYIGENLHESVYYVDTVPLLREHNDEYIYFRTDHHWTALGAYYVYEAICQQLGMEAAPLDSFEIKDQGRFQGSLYWKAPRTKALTEDNVIAYDPPGDLNTRIYKTGNSGFEWTVLTDMSKSNVNSKYMTFLAGDPPLVRIINNDLPDAGNCVVIKDSFGNCLAPFFTQNYHTVYVVDYRYYTKSMSTLISSFEIDDVIFVPNLGATQSGGVNDLLQKYKK